MHEDGKVQRILSLEFQTYIFQIYRSFENWKCMPQTNSVNEVFTKIIYIKWFIWICINLIS